MWGIVSATAFLGISQLLITNYGLKFYLFLFSGSIVAFAGVLAITLIVYTRGSDPGVKMRLVSVLINLMFKPPANLRQLKDYINLIKESAKPTH